MAFSCKIILADHEKQDGQRRVYLQAIIDRQPARVALDFYIDDKYFDARNSRVKSSHPTAESYNTELQIAISKANMIASKLRVKGKRVTPTLFRAEFEHPSEELDVIRYIRKELAMRSPELALNTIKQHNTVINKLEAWQKRIPFNEVGPEMMQRFKNFMIKNNGRGSMASSVDKNLKILKQYLDDARKKGFEFNDPFLLIRIKNFKSNRMALTEAEVDRLDKYYESRQCLPSHKKLLRYFLFSCYTGLRISDISKITWQNIHDDMLIYTPQKTKSSNKSVSVPLTKEKKYLPEFTANSGPIFQTFSDPVSNRYLKEVAGVKGVEIKKKITYHTSRHTFGSMMAEGGYLPETQMMMGHDTIKTTMTYVHTSKKSLIQAKQKRFSATESPTEKAT
jgi:integrase/recombinase XerD